MSFIFCYIIKILFAVTVSCLLGQTLFEVGHIGVILLRLYAGHLTDGGVLGFQLCLQLFLMLTLQILLIDAFGLGNTAVLYIMTDIRRFCRLRQHVIQCIGNFFRRVRTAFGNGMYHFVNTLAFSSRCQEIVESVGVAVLIQSATLVITEVRDESAYLMLSTLQSFPVDAAGSQMGGNPFVDVLRL